MKKRKPKDLCRVRAKRRRGEIPTAAPDPWKDAPGPSKDADICRHTIGKVTKYRVHGGPWLTLKEMAASKDYAELAALLKQDPRLTG